MAYSAARLGSATARMPVMPTATVSTGNMSPNISNATQQSSDRPVIFYHYSTDELDKERNKQGYLSTFLSGKTTSANVQNNQLPRFTFGGIN